MISCFISLGQCGLPYYPEQASVHAFFIWDRWSLKGCRWKSGFLSAARRHSPHRKPHVRTLLEVRTWLVAMVALKLKLYLIYAFHLEMQFHSWGSIIAHKGPSVGVNDLFEKEVGFGIMILMKQYLGLPLRSDVLQEQVSDLFQQQSDCS